MYSLKQLKSSPKDFYLTTLYLLEVVVSGAHPLLTDISQTGIHPALFAVIPIIFIFKSGLRIFEFPDRLHEPLNYAMVAWGLIALIYHTFFMKWALVEMLFVLSILYCGSHIVTEKLVNTMFNWGSLIFLLLIIIHTSMSWSVNVYTYAQPSESIMVAGIVGSLLVLSMYIKAKEEDQEKSLLKEKSKVNAVNNMILTLGHSIRTPLSTLRLKNDIQSHRGNFNSSMDDLNKEIDRITKLFSTFETAAKPNFKETQVTNLLDALGKDQQIPTQIIKRCNEFPALNPMEFRYHYTILNILTDNAIEYKKDSCRLDLFLDESGLSYEVSNDGIFFQPDPYKDKNGLFTSQIGNNRIGTSLVTAFSFAEAMGYVIVYTPLNVDGTGTKVKVIPS